MPACPICSSLWGSAAGKSPPKVAIMTRETPRAGTPLPTGVPKSTSGGMRSIPLVMGLRGACGVSVGEQGTALPCPCGGHGAGAAPQPLSLSRRFLCPARGLTRFLGMELGEGEGDTGASRGREKDGGRVRVSTEVTAGCRSTVPRPIRCPLTSVLTLGPASSPVPPRIPPTAPSRGRCNPCDAALAPGWPGQGTVALTWPGPRWRAGSGRSGPDTGLAWPAGMAQHGRRKRREGWSCSQEVWTWSQLRKREKNKKNLITFFFFFFFLFCPETSGFWHSSTVRSAHTELCMGRGLWGHPGAAPQQGPGTAGCPLPEGSVGAEPEPGYPTGLG